jgi:hypothetical protein
MEKVDEELSPYRAQTIFLRPFAQQNPEDLAEPLEGDDDLAVYVPVL